MAQQVLGEYVAGANQSAPGKMTPIAGAGWTAIARLRMPSGDLITQAVVDEAQVKVVKADGTVTQALTPLVVADVVYDTLQISDPRWNLDDTGWNFLYEVPAASFPSSGHYRVEFQFDPTTGADVFKVAYEGTCQSSIF